MNLLNVSYTQKYSVFAEDEMSFSYVVVERPAEEVLKCNESEKMDLNMCKTLSTSCTYFEESVPVPSTTINSDTSVQSINTTQSNTTTHPGTGYNNNINRGKKSRCCSKCDFNTTGISNFSRHQKVHQNSRIKHE